MNKSTIIITCTVILMILGFIGLLIYSPNPQPPKTNREIIQLPLATDGTTQQSQSIPATKLPEFTVDLAGQKLAGLLNEADKITEFVEAKIVHDAYATELKADISINKEKSELVVRPQDLPNFKPGKYKLHLTLRTLEGEVNIDQDFTWGVIAVNTNKSIYKPGDVAKIGMGVLNDKGETQCKTGENSAKVWLTVTDPQGDTKDYSTEENSIKDSGECSAVSVTNQPDFVSIYLINGEGLYKMKVTAEVNGEKRQIEDYFKVEPAPAFDVERSSFPTRIYPRAFYNVSFKVTPLSDYSGTIEEVVPSDFRISHITHSPLPQSPSPSGRGQGEGRGEGEKSKGKEETEGIFKKITWNVNLKKDQPSTFTYTIQFPLVSPEFYLLGPIKIGDFRESRQWQIASDAINSTSGVIAYENNGGNETFSRVWTGTAWNPAPPTGGTDMDTVGSAPADSRWFVTKSSPKTGEKLVAAYDLNGGTETIWMYRWDGASWGGDEVFTISVATPDVDTRIMDISYEEESGDALFVYADSTNQIKYRRKSSSSSIWDAAANAGSFNDSRPRWVKTKGQFGSDDILVAFLNNNERIGALIWNGTSNTFGNQFDDDDGPAQTEAATSAEEAYDIAWETQSGTPMIFWGDAASNILYREFTGGSWSGENTLYSDPANNVVWVTASSDPRSTSNYIAIASQQSNSPPTCGLGMWTGSAAETWPSTVTCRANNVGRLITTQFENNTGNAMFVYNPSANGTRMAWLEWTAGSGAPGSSTTETGDSGNIESIQLHSDLNTTSMMALYVDAAGDLWDRQWDGSSWSGKPANAIYDNIQNSLENAEAYGFGFDRNIETLVAYRWFNNNNGTDVGSVLTGGQDTPATLTTANPDFRLRMLLYYPDSLAISGRTYNLQFIDPGTGSCENPGGDGTPAAWTDVPTSGTEISYMNNGSVADADNLTANGNDPTYAGTIRNQDYEESNTFINSVSAMGVDEVGKWDFALHDNTTYDNTAQAFCFRATRSNGIVLHIDKYPKIITASLSDVIIQGGSLIQGGSELR